MKLWIQGIALAASVSFVGCVADAGGGSADDKVTDDSATAAAEGELGRTSQMLSRFESTARAVEQRYAQGTLSASLREAWASALTVRAVKDVAGLIAHVRAGASSSELLSLDASLLNRYVHSFDPLLKQLHLEIDAGTLDQELEGLLSDLLEVSDQVVASPEPEGRASKWCCSAAVTVDPFLGTTQTECWQWKTIGAWAVTKCAAIAVQHGSSSPYKGTCGNECVVIH